ncbi:COG4223 family protein [Aestuariibius insulae]|uniref:COG4223 family protein n=1 Tax=Aestuariibius insulae TaxID=2058287 RepID=UPI00345E5323
MAKSKTPASDEDNAPPTDVDPGVPEGGAEVPDSAPVMVDPQLKDDSSGEQETPPEADGEVPRDVEDGVPEDGAEVPDYTPTLVDPQLVEEGHEDAARSEIVDDEPEPVEAEELETTAPVAAGAATESKKSGGFLPLLLGGAIAAGLGFVAAYVPMSEGQGADAPDLTPQLEAQSERIAQLEADLAAVQSAPVGSAVTAEDLEALRADLSGGPDDASEDFSESITALDERLTALERQPTGEGSGASAGAVASFERELDGVRGEIAALSGELSDRDARIVELSDRIAAEEAGAVEAARTAQIEAAATQIRTAIATGEPYADALETVKGAADEGVVAALEPYAASGVPTLAALVESFPEAARAALTEDRSESGGVGVGAFLQSRLNVRSVEPREGTDADAVLSRVGAALDEGDLNTAVAELNTLPEAAQAAMSDWGEGLRARATAIEAAASMSLPGAEN